MTRRNNKHKRDKIVQYLQYRDKRKVGLTGSDEKKMDQSGGGCQKILQHEQNSMEE